MTERETMIYKRFFTEDDQHTQDSNDFCRDIHKALDPVIQEWIEKGFSPRDMMYLINSAGFMVCSHKMIKDRLEHRKHERNDG